MCRVENGGVTWTNEQDPVNDKHLDKMPGGGWKKGYPGGWDGDPGFGGWYDGPHHICTGNVSDS